MQRRRARRAAIISRQRVWFGERLSSAIARQASAPRKKAVAGVSVNARPPLIQTTGSAAAKTTPASAAHPPTTREPHVQSAKKPAAARIVEAVASALKGVTQSGRSALPRRIHTGNPGACGERSKRSKCVTAPENTASSISPGDAARAKKRDAATPPRTSHTRACGGRRRRSPARPMRPFTPEVFHFSARFETVTMRTMSFRQPAG